MNEINVVVVGGGRAAGAFAIACRRAGHRVSIVPGPSGRVVDGFEDVAIGVGHPMSGADLVIIAVSDRAIGAVAESLVARVDAGTTVVHLSGLGSVDLLAPLAAIGCPTGSLHPLMTLPDPTSGAEALAGSTATITASDTTARRLEAFARSLGMRPRRLADADKARYHAAAAAASNFVVAALAVASELARSVDVPFEAFRPLAQKAVSAAFDTGPEESLTGPVARGDWSTVAVQLTAIDRSLPDLSSSYRALIGVTARCANREDEIPDWMEER